MSAAKAIGCLCIIAASAMAGATAAGMLRRRWYFLREIYEMLIFLEQEIVCHRALLCDALEDAAKNCRTEAKDIFSYAAKTVRIRRTGDFANIWREALNKLPDGLLSEEEYLLLCETAYALCGTDLITQKLMMKKYADRFLALCKIEETAYQEKGRLYRTLSAAGGIFLVILLL